MNEWESRGVAEGSFMEEEIPGRHPGGWLRVSRGTKKEGVFQAVWTARVKAWGVESVAHLGHWEAFSEAGRGAVGGEGGSGWLCGAGRDGPEALTVPTVP